MKAQKAGGKGPEVGGSRCWCREEGVGQLSDLVWGVTGAAGGTVLNVGRAERQGAERKERRR